MYKFAALFLCVGGLFGQNRPVSAKGVGTAKNQPSTAASSGHDTELATLKETIAALARQVSDLESKLKLMSKTREILDEPAIQEFKKRGNAEAAISLTSRSFASVTDASGIGRFLVSVEKVEPYLDGSKVTMDVGNTLSANFASMTYTLSWNRRPPANEDDVDAYLAWFKTKQSKVYNEVTPIAKGQWNRVTAVLPGTKPDELGYLSIGDIELGPVGFR